MSPETQCRLAIALGISVGIHILFAVCAEAFSSGQPAPLAKPPVVEISRVAMDGTRLPSGKGEASFDSSASSRQPYLGQDYKLDAGVPMYLNVPQKPATNPTYTPPQQTQTTPPVSGQQPAVNQNSQPPANQHQQPQPQENQTADSPPQSNPSVASNRGNQGKPRSRGPNRVAMPIETFEASISSSLMGAGVENSVDVSVEISADGAHSERILRGSGSPEVDSLILEALRRWTWDPAAANGSPIASTQNFKFTFKARGT